ncbi:hypothetical protein AAK964_10275 [Tissierella praeacuta]|uniref:hypothetical protein n=1 Tax=Tissierella praeacuta TaxID=43131 RepID=UPI003519D2A9
MILEILGSKSIRVNEDEDVRVNYRAGKTAIYLSETTKYLVLNPDEIASVTISKKTEVK